MIVIVAVLLVALIGFGSLVFDMGHLYTVRGELQNTADSAALAGTVELDHTEEGLDRARERAKEYAARHSSDFRPSEISDDDIIFGHWDGEQFNPHGTDPNPEAVNAVRVRDRRAGEDAVTLRLAPVIGHQRADVSARAAAVAGGPVTECGAPLAVPDCALDEPLDSGDCEDCLVFLPHGEDGDQSAAFIDVAEEGHNVPAIRDQFRESCPSIDPDTGRCEAPAECGNEVAVGESRDLSVGNNMSTGRQSVCLEIEDRLTRGGDFPDGKPFVINVPVFAEGQCSGPITGGDRVIEGYAALEIHGVQCGGGHDPVPPGGTACGENLPSQKYIAGTLRCDLDSTEPGGGSFFGLEARPRLVE